MAVDDAHLVQRGLFAYVTFIVQEIAAPHVAFAQPGAAQIIVVVCGLHHRVVHICAGDGKPGHHVAVLLSGIRQARVQLRR